MFRELWFLVGFADCLKLVFIKYVNGLLSFGIIVGCCLFADFVGFCLFYVLDYLLYAPCSFARGLGFWCFVICALSCYLCCFGFRFALKMCWLVTCGVVAVVLLGAGVFVLVVTLLFCLLAGLLVDCGFYTVGFDCLGVLFCL